VIQEIDWEQKKAEAKARQALLNPDLSPEERKQAHRILQSIKIKDTQEEAITPTQQRAMETRAKIQQSRQSLEQQPGMLEEFAKGVFKKNILPPAEAISGTATGLVGSVAGLGRGWLERIKGASPAEAEQRERETAQSITTPIQTEQGQKIAGALQAPIQQALMPLVEQVSSDIHKWSGGKVAIEDARRGVNTAIILLPAVKGIVKTVPKTIRGFRALSKKAGATPEQLAALEKLPGDLAIEQITKMESKPTVTGAMPAPKGQPVLSTTEIIEQVIEPLKKLKPLGRQQKRMYGKEFGQRITKGEQAAREVGGEAGFYAKKARLKGEYENCLLYTSPSPRDRTRSRMPSSA